MRLNASRCSARSGASDNEQLPGHHGGDAVLDRRERVRVEAELGVVVGVRIDEPGSDHPAGGVEHPVRLAGASADGDDLAAQDRDVAVAAGQAPSRRRSVRYG